MSIRRLTATVAVSITTAIIISAQAAGAADGCLDQVRDFSSQRGMSSDPPTATPGKGEVTTQELARSGGVIKPPPVQDRAVIAPAPDKQDRMPTVPDIAPKAQQDAPAADRTKLQAALTAARERAEQGDEKGCQEALARARTLADRTN